MQSAKERLQAEKEAKRLKIEKMRAERLSREAARRDAVWSQPFTYPLILLFIRTVLHRLLMQLQRHRALVLPDETSII